MVDNDPLAKAEALLARYRTGSEPGQVDPDFPVLTEIVEPPAESSGGTPGDVQDTSSAQASFPEHEPCESPTRLIRSIEDRLDADFRLRLANDLVKRIEPVIGAFASQLAERMASEIASSVSQEVSRLLSEALADHTKARPPNDHEPFASNPPA
jgi:hypothetical protein